jgi:hypothetical protein
MLRTGALGRTDVTGRTRHDVEESERLVVLMTL